MRGWSGAHRWRAAVALAGSALVLGTALLGCARSSETPPGGGAGASAGTVVSTDNGVVSGTQTGETQAFQAIPYAAPPVGPLRWQDPRPAVPWQGVRDATKAGPACAQNPGELPGGSSSEDCLYLNVTKPAAPSPKPRPVVVWVHGGGFYMGAGSNYDASRMAADGDVVVVTLNYRLGVFGFLGLPGLPGSGTFGLRDQQAALSWVHRNAAAFGGDPGNVTLAGQSAGGVSSCAHLTSPSSAGLFGKAIMQSGSCELGWLDNFDFPGQPAAPIIQPLRTVEQHGQQIAAELNCTGDDPDVLACLRGLPVETLKTKLEEAINPAYGTPLLPIEPAVALRTGQFHRVPVLAGQTRDEATQTTSMYDGGKPMSEQTFRSMMTKTFGTDTAKVEAEYPPSAYGSAALTWSAIVTDRKWVCTQFDASRQLAQHVPVHHYEFADPAPPPIFPPTMPMGAQHASELWSLFDLGGIAPPFTPEQQRLSEQMIGYWTSFARTGVPSATESPQWPNFQPSGTPPHVQALAPGAGGIRPVDLAATHHCGFWQGLGR